MATLYITCIWKENYALEDKIFKRILGYQTQFMKGGR